MRPSNFPHARDFIEKLRKRKNDAHDRKVGEQLLMIARRLESFDEDCHMEGDSMENDCIKISGTDMGLCGIYSSNMKTIDENGWAVQFNEENDQYVFRIKGHFARVDEV